MSKPARSAISRRAHELRRAPCPCRRASSRAAPGSPATRPRAKAPSPASCRCAQRRIHRLPAELGRALRPGMAELDRDLGVGLGVDEIDDALPGRLVLGRIEAGAAGRDAALAARRRSSRCRPGRRRPWRARRSARGASRSGVPSTARYCAIGETTTRFFKLQVAQAEGREHRRARSDWACRPSPAPRTTSRRPRATPGRAARGSRG